MRLKSFDPRQRWCLRLALTPLLLVYFPTLASDAAILRCRAVADLAQRFVCYEAIVTSGALAATPKPAASASDDSSFGMENRQAPSLATAIASTIPGPFNGWAPNDIVLLANGQRWQIADDSRGVLNSSNPKITIRRGTMGAFYLEIEGTNRSPKVRRLR